MGRSARPGRSRAPGDRFGHRNPNVTRADQLLYDACLVIGDGARRTNESIAQTLLGGRYAILTLKGPYWRMETVSIACKTSGCRRAPSGPTGGPGSSSI
jgi:hypothetical protein